jgi:hypothetical protein
MARTGRPPLPERDGSGRPAPKGFKGREKSVPVGRATAPLSARRQASGSRVQRRWFRFDAGALAVEIDTRAVAFPGSYRDEPLYGSDRPESGSLTMETPRSRFAVSRQIPTEHALDQWA